MQEKICPYPGLRPFNEEESIFFKGREVQIERIVKRIGEKKFLMINGASGDGKSSLMYAGVIPYAKAGFFKAQFDNWLVVNFRPERKPLSNFAAAFCKELQLPDQANVEKQFGYGFSALLDLYKASNFFVDETAPKWLNTPDSEKKSLKRQAANLLILVDQFEEFFTNSENYVAGTPSLESQKTVNLLLETYKLALAQNLPVYVVCTMRSDYIGQCASFRGLAEAIGYSQFFVPRLKRQELEQVIEGPAALSGCKINKSLVQTLLNAAGEGFDQLPILQHALNSVWKLANNGEQQMEKIHLAKAGGIGRAALPAEEKIEFDSWFAQLPEYKKALLAKPSLNNVLNAHANELMEILPEHYTALTGKNLDKERIEHIVKISFQCLTTIDSGRAVRRRTTLQEITNIINNEKVKTSDVNAVLQIFREQGNTFLQPFVNEQQPNTINLKPETVLDITHESLIRNWTLLNEWAQEENENYTVWLEIEKQLNRWLSNKESANFLLAQGPLSYFEEWQMRIQPSKYWLLKYDETKIDWNKKILIAGENIDALNRFLLKSRKALRRKRNVLIYAVSAAFVVLALFTGWTLKERNKSNLLRIEAEENAKDFQMMSKFASFSADAARTNAKVASEAKITAQKSEQKAISAKDAAEKAKREALLAKSIAEQEKIKAEQQTLLATTEAQKAEAQRKIADDAKDKAISAEQKARQLTLTSLAQNLAYKSTQIEGDNELQGLLALQAYNFTVQNKQNVQDPVIYEALRAASDKRTSRVSAGFEARSIARSENSQLILAGKVGKLHIMGISNAATQLELTQNKDNIKVITTQSKFISLSNDINLPNEGLVITILLSPDAKSVLCGYADNRIILWNITDIEKPTKQVLYSGKRRLRCAAFSGSSNSLVCVNDSNTINLWKADKKIFYHFNSIPQIEIVKAIILSDDGNKVYWSLSNGEINFAETINPKIVTIYPAQEKEVSNCLAFSKEKNLLAAGLTNGSILLVNLNSNNVTTMTEKHLSPVDNIIFNSSGTLIASSASDKTIRIFNLEKKNSKSIVLRNQKEKTRSFLFLNDHELVAGITNTNLFHWELSSEKIADNIRILLGRQLSEDEWEQYVGKEIEYQSNIKK